MENLPPPIQKNGLGALGWIGIGCGGIVVLGIIAVVVAFTMFAPRLKNFAEELQKNPARAAATTMVTVGAGQIEMVAEDDANKRYTVREKQNGKLTTIYWDEKKKAAEIIQGDFSAIPADAGLPAPEPAKAPAESIPASAPK
jgi:hypothetical protein